jgi:fermentation-respiration switch protein FrsA (DUF1100 family)
MTVPPPIRRLVVAWALATLGILLAAPVAIRISAGVTGLEFLVEFLTEGEWRWLTRRTAPPVVGPLEGWTTLDVAAPDLWHPGDRRLGPWPGLLLIHGLTPEGKRDPRVAWTADRLARAGFAVAVPDLPALRAQRLRPDDARIIGETVARLAAHPAVRRGPLSMIAVSVGLGPAALALEDPALAGRVALVLALGGYGEARELIRYFTTGAYAFGGATGRVAVDPALAGPFLARNLDLLPDPRERVALLDAIEGRSVGVAAGPGVRAVLALLRNREPERVDALLEALPPETRAILAALSPAGHLTGARLRLLLVHGRDDPAIPFTESLRLAAAAGPRARPVIVGLIAHVEGQAPGWRRLSDLARLWTVCYELLAG